MSAIPGQVEHFHAGIPIGEFVQEHRGMIARAVIDENKTELQIRMAISNCRKPSVKLGKAILFVVTRDNIGDLLDTATA